MKRHDWLVGAADLLRAFGVLLLAFGIQPGLGMVVGYLLQPAGGGRPAAQPAQASPSVPNPALTPGALRSTSAAEICTHGYAKAHRVWHNKADTLARYGVAPARSGEFEDDDPVPVCLGGDNGDPRNHWA
jgi:hypothetical protein